MRKVYLHGTLQRHTDMIELVVDTAAEAVSALCVNFKGFIDDLRNGSWIIMRGDPETGLCLDEEAVSALHLGDADLHIMPEATGGKRGGVLKAIVGVALIGMTFGSAGFLASPLSSTIAGGAQWTNALGQIGVALTLAGVSTMLTPEQETIDPERDQSFTTTGPVSTGGLGAAVPIVYGEVITGGVMISGGLDAHAMHRGSRGWHEVGDSGVVEANPANDPANDEFNFRGLND